MTKRCLGLIAVGAVLSSCGPKAPQRTVRQADLDAWAGAPIRDLETHPLFSTVPRRIDNLSDGGQLWTYSNCASGITPTTCSTNVLGVTTCSGSQPVTSCCYNQFNVVDKRVVWYRAVGNCYTDCSVRPASRMCQ